MHRRTNASRLFVHVQRGLFLILLMLAAFLGCIIMECAWNNFGIACQCFQVITLIDHSVNIPQHSLDQ